MSVTHAVATLGRGPGRARSLTEGEAEAAMEEVLSGDAAPEAVGALLMLLRMKGETAEEIAGFVRAARRSLDLAARGVALDWPCYAAGRTRGAPWFLAAAQRVAQQGTPVLLHGAGPQLPVIRAGLADLGVTEARDAGHALDVLERDGIAFVALSAVSPALLRLLELRAVFGLRSCINTVLRMLNPFGAAAQVQGVFHPSYRALQADAAALLGQPGLVCLKGGGGEFERHPGKPATLFGLRRGVRFETVLQPAIGDTRRLTEAEGTLSAPCAFGRATINATVGAAALAFDHLVPA
ncbi:glycosyl transferase family protein [Jannaschia pohangensis]|uniref:Anthranilate phosphoribosyltransferase n=1 Tax=Jannaschia pohangensis TaxID=390807 RepID=A0A1I3HE85_9RHOB|nr:glycosyl transferase family protein [Jannaschia pohangensis]SFI34078.1 Anthranilate phosphoribosyltransferase [Jannaschia pohangensis]